MRHANASAEPGPTDFDRPLTEQGSRTAALSGTTIRALLPEIIVSSPAIRAKRTAQVVKAEAHIEQEIGFDRRLYEASASDLLGIATETDNQFARAMLVAHNPGLRDLVRLLTGKDEAMPPAGVAVIDFAIEQWRDIAPGNASLREVLRPHSLR